MTSKSNKYERLLPAPRKSFLLLGPRGVGKSTWLKSKISPKVDINLLKSDQYIQFQADPSLLRKRVSSLQEGDWVVIDEVQRVPELLNEVHGLYESHGLNFALTGSSARKLKRSNANLLAGRAIRCDMFPLSFGEIVDTAHMKSAIDYGTLPHVFTDLENAQDTLSTYVETYLKEEIAAEALTRNLEPFTRFLRIAAKHHAQLLNVEAIGSQAGVKRTSVDNYFQILEETLLGRRLPALRLGYRAKEASHSKFYFFDGGVARAAAGWLGDELPDTWRGFSFESLMINEVIAYNSYHKKMREFFHYTVSNSFDVDLVIETKKKILNRPATYIGIEIKLASHWRSNWSDQLRNMVRDPKSGFERGYGVYLGDDTFEDDGITIFSVKDFCKALWAGTIF
jgi:uncharacterized protein